MEEIAAAHFAVDREVGHCKVALSRLDLETNAHLGKR
jgi:hypothetical protein